MCVRKAHITFLSKNEKIPVLFVISVPNNVNLDSLLAFNAEPWLTLARKMANFARFYGSVDQHYF